MKQNDGKEEPRDLLLKVYFRQEGLMAFCEHMYLRGHALACEPGQELWAVGPRSSPLYLDHV